MKSFEISSELGICTIIVGKSLDHLIPKQKHKNHIFITDENIYRLYGDLFFKSPTIVIGSGEDEKNLKTLQWIFHRLLELEAERTTIITGVGGGMVCDVTGFAASTYMRGLRFNLMPTSLLAQVDASIGGKNGVNLQELKNIIGTFSQPEQVLLDFNLLKTLPQREISSGAAEIVKHALINSPTFFEYLDENSSKLFSLELDVVEKVVLESIKIKAAIVKADAREKGRRRLLNFGHTFGHAIEKIYGLTHGEAVSVGMAIALIISVSKGLEVEKDKIRILALLNRMNLPTHIPLEKAPLLHAIKGDKKRQFDGIHFVLLSAVGKPQVEKISFKELEGHINDLCELEGYRT